jgi:hypothetical protein
VVLNKLVPVGAWKLLLPLTDGIFSDVQVLALVFQNVHALHSLEMESVWRDTASG